MARKRRPDPLAGTGPSVDVVRKPSFVSRPRSPSVEAAIIPLERSSPIASSSQPAGSGESPSDFLSEAAPAYAALHPMGFAVPDALPHPRWALTPPFHPYRERSLARAARRSASLWHCPRRFRHRALPGIVLYGARTFLPSLARARDQRSLGRRRRAQHDTARPGHQVPVGPYPLARRAAVAIRQRVRPRSCCRSRTSPSRSGC